MSKVLSVKDLAEKLQLDYDGNADVLINGHNKIQYAGKGEITFYTSDKFHEEFANSQATCIICKPQTEKPINVKTLIYSDNPHSTFIQYLHIINDNYDNHSATLQSIKMANTSKLGSESKISPFAFIGENVQIGAGVIIYPNVVVLKNCVISDNSIIYPNVTIYPDTIIGKNCIVHAGAVIGSDGFGYQESKDGRFTKVPQLGKVIIEDDCEIGANTTIDRALTGTTKIGKGSKIDNLVQIAHNVEIGSDAGIASQVGIAGSTIIGDRVRLGGQVGISGHIAIVDDVIIYAQSGVASSIEQKGIYFGSPIKPRLEAFKIEAAIKNLPQLVRLVSKLERSNEDLSKK